MLRWTYGRTMILLIGGLGVLALAAQADSAQPPLLAQQVGRPSKADLLTHCQQRSTCRAKLDAAQKGQRLAIPRPMDQAPSAVSVYLTPLNWKVLSPYSDVELHGVVYADGRHILHHAGYNLILDINGEHKPFVRMNFTAPASAFYVLNVRASSAAAKLRHHSGGPIIEQWASGSGAGSAPCSAGGILCDYVTIEYLQQGSHKFYFYSTTHPYTFYSASIESYP